MTDYAIEQWRRERLECVSRCDICQKPSSVIHEFARGCNRQLALTDPCCQLVLCEKCHTGPKGVHDGGYTVAEQLAYLLLRRDSEFNVERYYKIIARRWPSLEDINHAHARLWQSINAKVNP